MFLHSIQWLYFDFRDWCNLNVLVVGNREDCFWMSVWNLCLGQQPWVSFFVWRLGLFFNIWNLTDAKWPAFWLGIDSLWIRFQIVKSLLGTQLGLLGLTQLNAVNAKLDFCIDVLVPKEVIMTYFLFWLVVQGFKQTVHCTFEKVRVCSGLALDGQAFFEQVLSKQIWGVQQAVVQYFQELGRMARLSSDKSVKYQLF
jgi:hypothetical protein